MRLNSTSGVSPMASMAEARILSDRDIRILLLGLTVWISDAPPASSLPGKGEIQQQGKSLPDKAAYLVL
jgi:hypothetical protein